MGLDKHPWPDTTGAEHPTSHHRTNNAAVVTTVLDVTKPAEALRRALRREMADDAPLVLVVHCAGVRGLVPAVTVHAPADVAAAETLDAMDAATLLRTYETNVVGTFSLLRAVLPNLRRAAAGVAGAAGRRPRVVVMSSRMGSIAANGVGGGYAYRASKAALNAVLKSLSVDVPEVHFALVHPGRVATGLVCVREEGAMSPEQSLETLLPLMERFGVGGEFESACFVDRFGGVLPW